MKEIQNHGGKKVVEVLTKNTPKIQKTYEWVYKKIKVVFTKTLDLVNQKPQIELSVLHINKNEQENRLEKYYFKEI